MLAQSPYLPCSHCGCEFLASGRQLKRSRSSTGARERFYCSAFCQRAGISAVKTKPPRYTGVCQKCGQPFASRHPRKYFCGMKCYTSSPGFLARIRAQAPEANAAGVLKLTGEERKPHVEITCLHCGTKRMVKPSEAKRRRYCNQRCYRQYMAARFDRWIASPEAIALPQAFDEFLSQEELPCLVDGCDWIGKHLGNHVNFTHGISADEFKRAAGFNLKTGLVTPAVSQALAERPHIHEPLTEERLKALEKGRQLPPPAVRQYRSLEAREHAQKAYALKAGEISTKPLKTCISCGTEYQPGPLAVNSKYCTVECRERWYKANYDALKFWLPCGKCGRDFEATLGQRRRSERGRPVFCGRWCRQSHNGSIRRKERHAECSG